jgi:hypothetical protein
MPRVRITFAIACAMLLAADPTAAQVTIASQSESTPYPGIRLVEGRTSSPNTDFHAAFVSLCSAGVHIDATGEPTGTRTVPSWANATGVELATNGDFYRTAPLHVYGDAVGGGARWAEDKTGRSSDYAGDWYYRDYGWIAFGDGWVEWSSTRYVKEHALDLGVTDGWSPAEVTTAIPAGTKALVSGFPQLVIEGERFPCVSATDDGCYPDRGDMRERHPRTAMGLTRDRKTFILVVVDGRTTASAGMYGDELARLMELLGAWTAFNLDGGGSSEMWVRGRGTINEPSDGSSRAVLNHWGVFAGPGNGLPDVPGSCAQAFDDLAHQIDGALAGAGLDLDGDGRADVCGRAGAGIVCHRSDGGRGFGVAVEGPALADDAGWADPDNYATLRFGDVDGDGRTDLCARANAGVRCWPSTGAGFGPAIEGPALSDDAGYTRISQFATLRLADVTGDGRADVCARDAERFRCWPSTGTGFGTALDGPPLGDAQGWADPSNFGTIRMGDLDGDGRADLCARADDGMRCWRSTGAGFEGTSIVGPAWSDAGDWNRERYWLTIRMDDVDGDGRADLCARGYSSVRCHLSTGDGFGPEIVAAPLEPAVWDDYANYSTVRLADVTGDGALDVCARGDDGVRCWPWAQGGFGEPIAGPLADAEGWAAPSRFRTMELADVDGDGDADLCARDADGLRCWASLGDRFAAEPTLGPAWSDAAGWDDATRYATIRLLGSARAPRPGPPPGDGGVDGGISGVDEGGTGCACAAAARRGRSGRGAGGGLVVVLAALGWRRFGRARLERFTKAGRPSRSSTSRRSSGAARG